MKTIYYLIIFLVVTTITACEKILDVTVPGNQLPRELVFDNAQTANAALAGLYAGLRDNSLLTANRLAPAISLYTDDLDFYSTTATNGNYELFQNKLIASNAMVYSIWSSTYQQIYAANAIIEAVDASKGIASTEKQRIRAEAMVLRAILYYHLQQLFGDIPYIDTTDYQVNKMAGKSNAAAVYIALEQDLKQCINLLNDNYANTERIFVNRKVVEMILAKVYMVQGKSELAEPLLKDIAESPIYAFENDVTKVFLKSGQHVLWQLKPRNVGDATLEASLYYFTGVAPSSYALSSDLVATFAMSDLRRKQWIVPVSVGSNTWYRSDKYKVRANNTTEYSIVFRLEEVYCRFRQK